MIRNDDSDRKEAARLRKVAAHRGLPRLKAYLSLLHSAESILLYGELKEDLVAWLTGHITLLEENTDLMMDNDDHSLWWNRPNLDHDYAGPVTRESHHYTVTEVAEWTNYADTLDRRFEERRAKREAALAEAERALAASQAIPENRPPSTPPWLRPLRSSRTRCRCGNSARTCPPLVGTAFPTTTASTAWA